MLTGIEFYVLSQFKHKSTAWLPIKKTHYLSKIIFLIFLAIEEDDNLAMLEVINKNIEEMKESIER